MACGGGLSLQQFYAIYALPNSDAFLQATTCNNTASPGACAVGSDQLACYSDAYE